MSALAVSRSPVPQLAREESAKRKKAEATEEKERSREPEPKPVGYDPATLCGSIFLELLDEKTPRLVADQIVRFSPEILFELSALEPQQVVDLVKHHIALSEYPKNHERNILSTVLILYSTSLINSRFGEGAKTLEQSEVLARQKRVKSELSIMLERSEKSHAVALVERAKAVLSEQVQPTPQELQAKITAINQITDAINHFANLFFYHTPSNRERFENIFTYSDRFPNCNRVFPRLMQNLSILKQEFDQLVALRSQLREQTMALQQQIAELQAPRVQKLPIDREQMLEHQAVLLWESGAELLEQGLKNVFLNKRRYRTYIPDSFKSAVDAASRNHEFRHFHFNALLGNRIAHFPPKYVCDVWDHYRGKESRIVDIADLMRHIIGKLPEPVFKQLETDLKSSEDKKATVLKALHQYFNKEFRGWSFSLTSLKDWLCA